MNDIDSIISSYGGITELEVYKKSNVKIVYEFINRLKENMDKINEVLINDNELFGYEYDIKTINNLLKANEEIDFNDKDIKFNLGTLACVNTGDPCLIIDLIIKSILTDSKIIFINDVNMINLNEYIINIVKEILKQRGINDNVMSIVTMRNSKDVIEYIKNINCIIVNKDYDVYSYFKNNANIKVIYLDYGNINIYTDCEDFDEEIDDIIKKAGKQNKDVYLYRINSLEQCFKEEPNNSVFNSVVIYTKKANIGIEFYKTIKATNVYINVNPLNDFDIGLDISEIQYDKRIIY